MLKKFELLLKNSKLKFVEPVYSRSLFVIVRLDVPFQEAIYVFLYIHSDKEGSRPPNPYPKRISLPCKYSEDGLYIIQL